MGVKQQNLSGGNEDASDDRMTATDTVKEACSTLIAQCNFVLDQLEETLPEVRKDRITMEEVLQNEGYEENIEEGDDDDFDGDHEMEEIDEP